MEDFLFFAGLALVVFAFLGGMALIIKINKTTYDED
jgi:hypothetical protein